MIELVLRIAFSLLIILGLMWGLARLARRPLAGRGNAALSVLSRQQLTRGSSVAVVRVVDRAYVLGVTDGQVSLLAETDLAAVERQLAGPAEKRDAVEIDSENATPVVDATTPGRLHGSLLSPATWRSTLNFLRERTVRH